MTSILSLEAIRTFLRVRDACGCPKDSYLAAMANTALRHGEALEQYARGDTPPYDEEQGAGYTARQALGWCCAAPDVIFDGKVNRCRNCLATKGAA